MGHNAPGLGLGLRVE